MAWISGKAPRLLNWKRGVSYVPVRGDVRRFSYLPATLRQAEFRGVGGHIDEAGVEDKVIGPTDERERESCHFLCLPIDVPETALLIIIIIICSMNIHQYGSCHLRSSCPKRPSNWLSMIYPGRA